MADTELWVRRLTDGSAKYIFGDKRIPYDLADEVRDFGGSDGGI